MAAAFIGILLQAGDDGVVQVVVDAAYFFYISGIEHLRTGEVEGADGVHFFIRKLEVPDIQVLFHAFLVNGLGMMMMPRWISSGG